MGLNPIFTNTESQRKGNMTCGPLYEYQRRILALYFKGHYQGMRREAHHCHWATVEFITVRMPWPKDGSRYAELRKNTATIQSATHRGESEARTARVCLPTIIEGRAQASTICKEKHLQDFRFLHKEFPRFFKVF